MTTVVNIKTEKADVYIGRGSKWGNPFKMTSEDERDKVCEQYEAYFWTSGLFKCISELVDKSLGCYCKPKRCHGDFLAQAAEFYKANGFINRTDFEEWRKSLLTPSPVMDSFNELPEPEYKPYYGYKKRLIRYEYDREASF